MKYVAGIFLSFLFVVSCTPKNSKPLIFDAQISDLNGTWGMISTDPEFKITEKEILEYRRKAHADSSMNQQFSWGVGSFNVNGSWYFDITDNVQTFYDGIFLYSVVDETKTDVSSIDLLIMYYSDKMKENDKTFLKENETIQLHIVFLNKDTIKITNPDKKIFIDTGGPIVLYRLSGPQMPVGQ